MPVDMFSAQDSNWMALALRLAEQGLHSASPNPRVGCVLVHNGIMVGSGWHRCAGSPHAEVYALREAGNAAHGATAYVTLEPCCHHGRTPPCADALIEAGIARVVTATRDPNPLVAGRGVARLRASGITVECGLMEAEARELNIGFFSRMERGIPWLRCKIALSLDGRTALHNGKSKWITSAASRQDVQQWRACSCAVLTGINTVLADDARLNARGPATTRQPLRVVLDSKLRIPLEARVLRDGGHTLIYTTLHDTRKMAALQDLGASVVTMPNENCRVRLLDCLQDLARRGCNEILVEAGSILNGALLRASLTDELLLYIAPQLLGDAARCMAQLGELTDLDQRIDLNWQDIRQVGADLRILARIKKD